MINPENRDDLDEEPKEEQPKRPSLSERWRRRAVRYGSKVEGKLNDIDVEKVEREHRGDPFGPSAPVIMSQGFLTGGRRSRWDTEPTHELDEYGKVKEPEPQPFPETRGKDRGYEADDQDVLWSLFRIRS